MKIKDRPSLVKIGLYNFKAFKSYTELELDELTVLAGLNSSGKSSLYQSLLLLLQSTDSWFTDTNEFRIPALRLNGKLVELGAPIEVLSDVNLRVISFSLFWSNNYHIDYEYILAGNVSENSTTEFENKFLLSKYKVINDKNQVEIETVRSVTGEWHVAANTSLGFENTALLKLIGTNIEHNLKKEFSEVYFDAEEFDPYSRTVKFDKILNILFRNTSLVKFKIPISEIVCCLKEQYIKYLDIDALKRDLIDKNVPSETVDLVNNNQFIHEQIDSVGQIEYIRPFRGYPKRIYTSETGPSPLSTYPRNRTKIIAYEYDTKIGIIKEGTVEDALKYWLVDYFKLAERIEAYDTISGLVSEVYLSIDGKKIAINNVGFGTSQIIPVIYKTLLSRSDLIIIDEPEIHLHASIQSKLATFFFSMMLIGKKLLLETHSEYLIDKLIYHNILESHDGMSAKLWWVKKATSYAIVERMQHDDLGYIANMPEGFLSEKKLLVEEINKLRARKY